MESLLLTLNKFHTRSVSFVVFKHKLLIWMSVCLEKTWYLLRKCFCTANIFDRKLSPYQNHETKVSLYALLDFVRKHHHNSHHEEKNHNKQRKIKQSNKALIKIQAKMC